MTPTDPTPTDPAVLRKIAYFLLTKLSEMPKGKSNVTTHFSFDKEGNCTDRMEVASTGSSQFVRDAQGRVVAIIDPPPKQSPPDREGEPPATN
jgi:hypothetical protein